MAIPDARVSLNSSIERTPSSRNTQYTNMSSGSSSSGIVGGPPALPHRSKIPTIVPPLPLSSSVFSRHCETPSSYSTTSPTSPYPIDSANSNFYSKAYDKSRTAGRDSKYYAPDSDRPRNPGEYHNYKRSQNDKPSIQRGESGGFVVQYSHDDPNNAGISNHIPMRLYSPQFPEGIDNRPHYPYSSSGNVSRYNATSRPPTKPTQDNMAASTWKQQKGEDARPSSRDEWWTSSQKRGPVETITSSSSPFCSPAIAGQRPDSQPGSQSELANHYGSNSNFPVGVSYEEMSPANGANSYRYKSHENRPNSEKWIKTLLSHDMIYPPVYGMPCNDFMDAFPASDFLPPMPAAVRSSRSTANTPRVVRYPSTSPAADGQSAQGVSPVDAPRADSSYHLNGSIPPNVALNSAYVAHKVSQGLLEASTLPPEIQSKSEVQKSGGNQSALQKQKEGTPSANLRTPRDPGDTNYVRNERHYGQHRLKNRFPFRQGNHNTAVPANTGHGAGRNNQHTQAPYTARAILQEDPSISGNATQRVSGGAQMGTPGSAYNDDGRSRSGLLVKFLDSLKVSLGLSSTAGARRRSMLPTENAEEPQQQSRISSKVVSMPQHSPPESNSSHMDNYTARHHSSALDATTNNMSLPSRSPFVVAPPMGDVSPHYSENFNVSAGRMTTPSGNQSNQQHHRTSDIPSLGKQMQQSSVGGSSPSINSKSVNSVTYATSFRVVNSSDSPSSNELKSANYPSYGLQSSLTEALKPQDGKIMFHQPYNRDSSSEVLMPIPFSPQSQQYSSTTATASQQTTNSNMGSLSSNDFTTPRGSALTAATASDFSPSSGPQIFDKQDVASVFNNKVARIGIESGVAPPSVVGKTTGAIGRVDLEAYSSEDLEKDNSSFSALPSTLSHSKSEAQSEKHRPRDSSRSSDDEPKAQVSNDVSSKNSVVDNVPGEKTQKVSTTEANHVAQTANDVIASPMHSLPPAPPKTVRFSWRIARSILKLRMQPADTFSVQGVPFSSWELQKIPTLGASPTSCRVQEMFKASIQVNKSSKPLKVFIKRIPIAVWERQYESQNKWNGEYITDGENFVMEAAALSFLQEYGHSITPSLLGILELSSGSNQSPNVPSSRTRHVQSRIGRRAGCFSSNADVTHIVIVSELYGEDLLDFLDRREKENKPLHDDEKKRLQCDCLLLLRLLHNLGFAHLDFTPENVLYGSKGLRLCDFAKATPLWTYHHRHVAQMSRACQSSGSSNFSTWFPFESCEPTVGKGAYMPPECWKVYWRLEETKIQYPLEELWSLQNAHDRSDYYFRVCEADIYMLGVLTFWIWSDGGIWKCSDPRQDEKYSHLLKSSLNFDLFRECRCWPAELKDLLQKALRPEPLRRATIDELISHAWFSDIVAPVSKFNPKLAANMLRNSAVK